MPAGLGMVFGGSSRGMEPEHAIAAAGLGFLLVGGVLMIGSVRHGREVCRLFAERFPDAFAEAGSPRPGYFDSLQRNAYFQYLMKRRFAELPDPYLVERFTALRRSEMRFLGFLLGGFAVLGLALVWLYWIRPLFA